MWHNYYLSHISTDEAHAFCVGFAKYHSPWLHSSKWSELWEGKKKSTHMHLSPTQQTAATELFHNYAEGAPVPGGLFLSGDLVSSVGFG